jgi:hypothetical protein
MHAGPANSLSAYPSQGCMGNQALVQTSMLATYKFAYACVYFGCQTLVVKHWWSNIGGQTLVVKHWWSNIGGQTLVVKHWR